MVDKLVRLTADQRSNFVAYLDGELSEDETRSIEKLLASNEVARHDMESLATAWELLDELPRANASTGFAEKTLEILKQEEHVVPLGEQPWFQRTIKYGNFAIGWGLVFCCGVVGFIAARSVVPSRADTLIHEYPMLEHFESYQEIGSSDFLNRLLKSKEWSRHQSEGTNHE